MKLYGYAVRQRLQARCYDRVPWITTDKRRADRMAEVFGGEVVEVEVKKVTPKRRATTARNEEKQMAKAKAKKPAGKAPAKKGKC